MRSRLALSVARCLLAGLCLAATREDLDKLIRSYERSRGGHAALVQATERLQTVAGRYAEGGSIADYARDADVIWLITQRYPGVYRAVAMWRLESDPDVRRVLLHVIRGIGWRGAAEYLASRLGGLKDAAERAEVCAVIGELGGGRALGQMESFLRRRGAEEDERVVVACVTALGLLARSEADRARCLALVKSLSGTLRSPSGRLSAAMALHRFGEAGQAEHVLAVALDAAAERGVRLRAIGFFRDAFYEPAVAALARLCESDDETIAGAALEALSAMTRYGLVDFETAGAATTDPPVLKEDPAEGPAEPTPPPAPAEEAQRILAWWAECGERVRRSDASAAGALRWEHRDPVEETSDVPPPRDEAEAERE